MKSLVIKVDALPGFPAEDVVADMIKLSQETQCFVETKLNRITISTAPNSTIEGVYKEYKKRLEELWL